jgi:hypothetical protein
VKEQGRQSGWCRKSERDTLSDETREGSGVRGESSKVSWVLEDVAFT